MTIYALEEKMKDMRPELIRELHTSLDRAIADAGGWSMLRVPQDVGALIDQHTACKRVYLRKTGKRLS